MKDQRKPVLKDKLRGVTDDPREHPFFSNTIVEVVEVMDHGVVWVKNKDGTYGCLIPHDYIYEEK
ncbi:hypothetical protein [Bacillus sp. EB01]|uniref:hypothetical protein n=1 Tax=Bacillus sp. EB01 TaxID=1347086 RepID=UPI0005C46F42|nr:hypothetical protein [Bacillus sp. EB01]